MSDDIWARDEVESPCNKICMIHPKARICIGCYRTADEIAGWSRFTNETRRSLIEELPNRADQLPGRRGGRSGRARRKST